MEESIVSTTEQVDLTADDCNVKDEIETANAEKQPECVNLDSSDDSILINSEIDKVEKATAEEIEAKEGVDIDAKVKETPSENQAIDNPAKLTNEPDTFEVNLDSPPDKIATPSKSIKKDPINLDPIDLDQINSPDTFDEKSEAVEQNEDILSISSEIEMSDETENVLEHHEKISLEKEDENVEENAVKNAKENVEENAELDAKMNVEVDAEKNAKKNAKKDAEEDAKMSVVQDVEKNAKEDAEENAKEDAEENAKEDAEENANKDAEENVKKDAEMNVEEDAEENAVMNVEGNAEKNAEEDDEEDAEKNPEENAGMNVEEDAEEDDEEDAEKNREGDAEEDAEMNVEKKMYKNVEVNAEDAPIDNSEMNELNIDEQIMESKATNADDPRDTDKENNDDDEDDDDYDDDAESNQVMEVDKARSVSPTDSVNSKDTFNSEKTDENKSDSKTEADDTTETEAVIFVELDKDDNLNFEKDTDDKCDIDPLEQLNMANGTNGDEENTKDKLNEPIEREIIAQDDDPLSDGKAVSITTAETSNNLKADKEMVDDIVMIITDSEDEEESQAATKKPVEEKLPEKELPPKENDTKTIEPIKEEDVAKPTQPKTVDDVIMVDVDPLDITSKNKKLENIPESQIEATKLKDLEPAKTDEKPNEIPSTVEIAPEKKTEKEKIVDDDIIMLDEDDDELPEKSDQTEEIAPVNSQAESKIDGQNKDTNNITENIKESINKLESNSVKQQAPASLETTSSSSTPSTPTLTSSAAASNPLTNEPTQPTASVEKPSTPPKKQSPVAPTQSIVASKQLSATPIPPPLKEIETLLNKFPTNDSTKMESKKRGKLPEKPSDNKVTKTSSGIVKECVNFECTAKRFDNFIKAPIFVLSHFNVPRKFSRTQYVCVECFDKAIESYSRLAGALLDEQPLLLQKLPKRTDLVEILDSSDEEDAKAGRDIDGDECLSSSILATLEEHFDTVFRETIEKVNLTQQMDWTMSILDQKVKRNEEMSLEIDQEIKSLQKMADSMYRNLYKNSNYVIEDLPPFDLNTNKQMQLAGPYYPPFGELQRAPLDTVSLYYAVRQKMLAAWIPCKMMEPMTGTLQGSDKCYKVKFLRTKGMLIKCVPQNHIAYGSPPSVRLQVGERVIALFQMETPSGVNKENSRALFFPGVIAEPLQAYNRWRYLVFFDDGYAQYVSPDNVRVIVGVSQKVWEDVHPDSANFIENYLTQYKTQRPMVQVRKGQRMITEWNSKWLYAKVNEIDSSLVQMYFEEGKRNEWIYRGSTRLGPLFRERQQAQQKHSVGLTKRNEPYVEYMSLVDDDGKLKNLLSSKPQKEPGAVAVAVRQPTPPLPPLPATSSSTSSTSSTTASIPSAASAAAAAAAVVAPASSVSLPSRPAPTTHNAQFRTTPPITQQQEHQTEQQQQEEKRAVAKKSASAPARPQIQHMNNSTIYVEEDNRPKGKVVYYTAKKHMPPRKYVPHTCNTNCLYEVKHNLSSYSPLAKPLLSGWERQICKSKTKKVVMYRAPCGRRLRSMSELHQYLRMTSCPLNVENFDFDYLIHCLAEYVIDSCIMQNSDISGGAENMVVPCVNYYDNTTPPPCIYSAKRIPTEGVNLNLDKEFLCGCDCEDDCLDKMKCQCWQLTLAGAKFGNPNTPPDQVGYEFKRLPDPVPTGIYECNSKCRCARTCLNRVAQQPLQMKLQVFKTGNRGWGLRCLNDVPKGSFICIYAGDLLTEQNANEAGDNYGDEYFAELDYIEVVESLKEGYEPDVVNDDDFEDEEYDADRSAAGRGRDTDDDEFVSKTQVQINKTRYNTRNSDALKRRSSKSSDNASNDEEEERPTLSFVPNPNAPTFDKEQSANKYKSIRKFYGKNEFCYIMDAKKTGNIGRYFNHSCSPNLFVQNVFVDTHDLRFPWVAFFALSHIRAGTELTWNYNYDVGSVPGKVLYCQCGSESCRGRLL